MKRMKQGYNDRIDDSLGMRNRGPHKQNLKSRRHESEGMEKAEGRRAYSGDLDMDIASRMRRAAKKRRR